MDCTQDFPTGYEPNCIAKQSRRGRERKILHQLRETPCHALPEIVCLRRILANSMVAQIHPAHTEASACALVGELCMCCLSVPLQRSRWLSESPKHL